MRNRYRLPAPTLTAVQRASAAAGPPPGTEADVTSITPWGHHMPVQGTEMHVPRAGGLGEG